MNLNQELNRINITEHSSILLITQHFLNTLLKWPSLWEIGHAHTAPSTDLHYAVPFIVTKSKSGCMVGCTPNKMPNPDLSFYNIPRCKTEPKCQPRWLKVFNRQGGPYVIPRLLIYMCIRHFLSGTSKNVFILWEFDIWLIPIPILYYSMVQLAGYNSSL